MRQRTFIEGAWWLVAFACLGLAFAAQLAAADGGLRVQSAELRYDERNPAVGALDLKLRAQGYGFGHPADAAFGIGYADALERHKIEARSIEENGGLLVYNGKLGAFEIASDTGLITAHVPNLGRGLGEPLVVRFRFGGSEGCAMLRMQERSRNWFTFDAKNDPQFHCALTRPPSAEVDSLFPGESTMVRISIGGLSGAATAENPALDRKSLRVIRVDDKLAQVGEPLCTLVGAVDPNTPDAGEYRCTITVDEMEPETLHFAVEGKYNDERVLSPQFSIRVLAGEGDAGTIAGPSGESGASAGVKAKGRRKPSLGISFGTTPTLFSIFSRDSIRRILVFIIMIAVLSTVVLMLMAYSDLSMKPRFIRNCSILLASGPALALAHLVVMAGGSLPARNGAWFLLTLALAGGSRKFLSEKVRTSDSVVAVALLALLMLGVVSALGFGQYLSIQE